MSDQGSSNKQKDNFKFCNRKIATSNRYKHQNFSECQSFISGISILSCAGATWLHGLCCNHCSSGGGWSSLTLGNILAVPGTSWLYAIYIAGSNLGSSGSAAQSRKGFFNVAYIAMDSSKFCPPPIQKCPSHLQNTLPLPSPSLPALPGAILSVLLNSRHESEKIHCCQQ